MADLAKLHISVEDLSFNSVGAGAQIPLFIIATEQDKVLDATTNTIAEGTKKENANKLLLLSGRSELVSLFGTATFYSEGGTVVQGSETSEYGLDAAYRSAGLTENFYVIRADIDLKQLRPTNVEPTSKAKNKTLWLDENTSCYGLFRANGNTINAKAWDKVERIYFPKADEVDLNGVPLSTFGSTGDVAIVNVAGHTTNKMFEKIGINWYELGSSEWSGQKPQSVVGSVIDPEIPEGCSIVINGVEIPFTGVDVARAAKDINGTFMTLIDGEPSNTIGDNRDFYVTTEQIYVKSNDTWDVVGDAYTYESEPLSTFGSEKNVYITPAQSYIKINGEWVTNTIIEGTTEAPTELVIADVNDIYVQDLTPVQHWIKEMSGVIPTITVWEDQYDVLTWTASVEYTKDSYVFENNKVYKCNLDTVQQDTFVVSDEDNVYWVEQSDVSVWVSGTKYNKDTFVYHEGVVYKALEENEQVEFATTREGEETTVWNLMADYHEYLSTEVPANGFGYNRDTYTLQDGSIYVKANNVWGPKGYTYDATIERPVNPYLSAANSNGRLMITSTYGDLVVESGEKSPFTVFGFVPNSEGKVVAEGIEVIHAPHTSIPSGQVIGSYWIKTTEPNFGTNLELKTYNASANNWSSEILPFYSTFLSAEAFLGQDLETGSRFAKYTTDGKTDFEIYEYTNAETVKITGTVVEPVATVNDVIGIKTLNSTGKVTTYSITMTGTDVSSIIRDLSNANIPNMKFDIASSGAIIITNTKGYAVELIKGTGDSLETIGFTEGEYGKWNKISYKASITEPTEPAVDSTLWFNPDFAVDIMVNDGDEWRGYRNIETLANTDINGIQITSAMPETQSNGNALVEGDLWLDSSDTENYPAIYRYTNDEWVLIDNKDQSTPYGIVFADARANAGPSYIRNEVPSGHTPFSTKTVDLTISDYVDPDCVDPRTYPAGILLFNMRYSTYNIKEYRSAYFENAVADYGTTFKVGGNDTTPSYATPGTEDNPVIARWIINSGNDLDGVGYFGRKAQRISVVRALQSTINTSEDLRVESNDFFYVTTGGYLECDDELKVLNAEKGELFEIVTDTPARLVPNAGKINDWATNANNAASHGEAGRTVQYTYSTRSYPSMALASDVNGYDVAIPSSTIKMLTLLSLPQGQIPAGNTYGLVTGASSVGYITDEQEYSSVEMRNGVASIVAKNNMNPIMYKANGGLMFWGENTEQSVDSALSREHAIHTLLRLKRQLDATATSYFFKKNTPALRANFTNAIEGILAPLVANEELYDYVVVCNDTNNTDKTIAARELWCQIGVEIVEGCEQIYIPIVVYQKGQLSA